MRLFSVVAICLPLVLGRMLLPVPAIAATSRYAYTKIADTVGDVREIANAGINNSGTVVFLALFDAGGRSIITGNEQRLSIVADTRTGAFEDLVESASVNDRGVVAFASRGTAAAVWKWDAGRLRRLADSTSALYRSFGGPSINAAGDVAFWSQLTDSSDGIFVSVNNNRVVRVAGGKDGLHGLDNSPAIGNSGVVAFVGQIPVAGTDAVFLADQKRLRVIVDATGRFSVFDGGLTVNSSEAVAFRATQDAGPDVIAVATTSSIVDVADDGGVFAGVSRPTINAIGSVAFQAQAGGSNNGVFTGRDAVADKVIGTGDVLDGDTVVGVDFFRGLNDKGQVAFVAHFQTHSALYRADRVAP